MQSSDQDLMRRLLAAILDRLEASPDGKPVTRLEAGDSLGVVLVLLAQVEAKPAALEARPAVVPPVELIQSAGARPHPGLEKFPLPEPMRSGEAPKTCFMEPGRVCVNSGACEMRGY